MRFTTHYQKGEAYETNTQTKWLVETAKPLFIGSIPIAASIELLYEVKGRPNFGFPLTFDYG
jgi:hypothetical protein